MEIVERHWLPIKRLTLASAANEGVVIWLAGPVWATDVPEPLWNCLSNDERNRANRFFHDRDRNLFAMTRAILRSLLSEATSVPANQILFAEGPYGKPRLAGIKGPHFNVSHSGSWALIGLSDRRPIGVDIELTRKAGDELRFGTILLFGRRISRSRRIGRRRAAAILLQNLDLQRSGSEGDRRRNFRTSQGVFSRIDQGSLCDPSRI